MNISGKLNVSGKMNISGNITGASILPGSDNQYDIGNETHTYAWLFAQNLKGALNCGNFTGNESDLCTIQDSSIEGVKTVDGGNLDIVESKAIAVVGDNSSGSISLDVKGGVFLNVSGDAQSRTSALEISSKLNISGQNYFNVSANYTGQDILPYHGNQYDLGNETHTYAWLFAQNLKGSLDCANITGETTELCTITGATDTRYGESIFWIDEGNAISMNTSTAEWISKLNVTGNTNMTGNLSVNKIFFVDNTTGDVNVTGGLNLGTAAIAGAGTINASGTIYAHGGVIGASPAARIRFNNYYDDSGDPSASHIVLYDAGAGAIYGIGISANDFDIISGVNTRIYEDATERLGILTGGDVNVTSGDLILGTNAKQIKATDDANGAEVRILDLDTGPDLNIGRDDTITSIQLFGRTIIYDDAASPATIIDLLSGNKHIFFQSGLDLQTNLSIYGNLTVGRDFNVSNLTGTIELTHAIDWTNLNTTINATSNMFTIQGGKRDSNGVFNVSSTEGNVFIRGNVTLFGNNLTFINDNISLRTWGLNMLGFGGAKEVSSNINFTTNLGGNMSITSVVLSNISAMDINDPAKGGKRNITIDTSTGGGSLIIILG